MQVKKDLDRAGKVLALKENEIQGDVLKIEAAYYQAEKEAKDRNKNLIKNVSQSPNRV